MRTPRVTSEHPLLTWTDAWLLAALTWRRHPERPAALWELIENADWLERSLPTYDMLSFGLQRLVAAGYVVTDGNHIGPTREALQLLDRLKKQGIPDGLGGPVEAMGRAFRAPSPPVHEAEDRSLGRLPGLTAADVAEAEARYREWFRRWEIPSVVAGVVLALILTPLILVAALVSKLVERVAAVVKRGTTHVH